jgi:hypothetical protein
MSPAFVCKSVGILAALGVPLLSGCYPDDIQIEHVLTQTEVSEHFVFHYAPGDRVDAPRVEAFYAWIAERLSVDLEKPVQFFKFENNEQKRFLTGSGGNGHADPATNSVYTIWTWDNHEVTHLFSHRLGTPTAFLNEGLAVANQVDPLNNGFTPMWGLLSVHGCAADLFAAGELSSWASVGESEPFRKADPHYTYPSAGSFVEHLTQQYGIESVLQLFSGARYHDSLSTTSARFQRVYGFSLETAEQDWHAFLAQYPR